MYIYSGNMDPFPIRRAANGSYSSWMELAGGHTHSNKICSQIFDRERRKKGCRD